MILPGSASYTTQTVDSYWDVRVGLSPACVVVPYIAAEVSQAVNIINERQANFAVCGGGHMNVSNALLNVGEVPSLTPNSTLERTTSMLVF